MLLLKSFIEFIGTFIFLGVILSVGQAIPIGAALAVAIMFGGKISGGHFNPAVSLMMFVDRAINAKELVFYVLSQCLGGITVLALHKYAVKHS